VTKAQIPTLRVGPARPPGSRVFPIRTDGPRGFALHQRVLADDGQRTRPGRIIWDGREGWAVLVEPDHG